MNIKPIGYYSNGYIIRISRHQDDTLKIRAKTLLWNIVANQIPRGCVWNLQKNEEIRFGSFGLGLLQKAEHEQYLNGFLSAFGVSPDSLEILSVEDKGLLCMKCLANKE